MIKTEKEIMKYWSSSKKPLVTISCITYNHEQYIELTIKKFLEQETSFPFEIIIHDDASNDNTPKIILKYQKQYPNIIFPIFQNENQYSKNIKPHMINFAKSKGDYIALCDGDDYWIDKNKLQFQFDTMIKNKNCDISFHGVVIENFKTKRENIKLLSKKQKIFKLSKIILLDHRLYTSTVTFMIRKSLLKKLPEFFAKTPTLDYYLMIFGSLSAGALYIPKVMSHYRLYSDNSWHLSEKSSKQYLNNIKSLIKLKNYLKITYISVVGLKITEFFLKYLIFALLKR